MKRKSFPFLMLTLAVAGWLVSCSQEAPDVSIAKPDAKSISGKTIMKAEAVTVASRFLESVKPTDSKATRSQPPTTEPFLTESGDTIGYAVNIPSGGWVLVGKSKDYYPILAYSDDPEAVFNPKNLNPGLAIWKEEVSQAVHGIGGMTKEAKAQVAYEWMKLSAGVDTPHLASATDQATLCRNRLKELNDAYRSQGWTFTVLSQVSGVQIPQNVYDNAAHYGSPLSYTIVGLRDSGYDITTGPLLSTNWHQYEPYNAKCPSQQPAGCVPVAMAQIMKFHQFPAQFQWSRMLGSYSSSQYAPDVAELIHTIGVAIGVVYGSLESTATIDDAAKGFREYGYYVVKKSHNSQDVIDEVEKRHRPVYMRGNSKLAEGGHAWVCDGIIKKFPECQYYVEYLKGGLVYDNLGETLVENPGVLGGLSPTDPFFHMNWGWKPGSELGTNGWYINATTDKGLDLNTNRQNLYVSK